MIKEDLLVPLVGVVVAAVIAGVVSLVVAILAKDQTTSEFRQSWIDALREDVAKLAGHWFIVTSAASDHREGRGDATDFLMSQHDYLIQMEICINRIILRLNPDEHVVLLKMLDQLGSVMLLPQKQKDSAMHEIVLESQGILKAEWTRVKRGEWSFRLLKWGSSAAVLIAAVTGYCIYRTISA